MYDIIFIQKFLLKSVHHNKSLALSNSWRHQFMWLNDMLSKLNEQFLIDAQSIDSTTFASYFFDCVFGLLSTSQNNSSLGSSDEDENEDYYDYYDQSASQSASNMNADDSYSSSYLTSFTLYPSSQPVNSSRLVCSLDKYDLTQQIHFTCTQIVTNHLASPNKTTEEYLQSKIVFDDSNYYLNTYLNRTKRYLTFVLFENDKLFPKSSVKSVSSTNESFSLYKYESTFYYDDLTEQKAQLTDTSFIESTYTSNRTACAQILALITSNNKSNQTTLLFDYKLKLNLTLEIKMPARYYNLIGLIQNRLVSDRLAAALLSNKTKANNFTSVETEKNLFDQIFYRYVYLVVKQY
jgi:hypothetical protein